MGSPRLKATPNPPTPLGGGDGGARGVDVAQSPPASLRLLRPLLQKKIERQRQRQRERERERERERDLLPWSFITLEGNFDS